MDKVGYTYILSNERNGTLYVGVTSNLTKRIQEHKHKVYAGFTSKYNVSNLVWFQEFTSIQEAILYEKKIKGRMRFKKLQLIEQSNPPRRDLSE